MLAIRPSSVSNVHSYLCDINDSHATPDHFKYLSEFWNENTVSYHQNWPVDQFHNAFLFPLTSGNASAGVNDLSSGRFIIEYLRSIHQWKPWKHYATVSSYRTPHTPLQESSTLHTSRRTTYGQVKGSQWAFELSAALKKLFRIPVFVSSWHPHTVGGLVRTFFLWLKTVGDLMKFKSFDYWLGPLRFIHCLSDQISCLQSRSLQTTCSTSVCDLT